MKQPDVSQMVSIVANLGVIAGIVFLAFELRQNTQAVVSETGQGLQDQIQAIYSTLDNELWGYFLKGRDDPASLSPVETARINSFYITSFLAHQNIYFQVRNGTVPADRVEGWWQHLRNNLDSSLAKAAWEQQKYLLSEEFKQFVAAEVMLREPTGDTYFQLPFE